MAQNPSTETAEWVPPYISFRTITDLMSRMANEEPPSRIDKSYLASLSGGYQTQVIGALNALGLRDKDTGALTEAMLNLVKGSEPERKSIIKEILEKGYSSLIALGTNATQQQMLEGFKALGVNAGDTMRKSVSFYLNAAKYAEVPISRYWKTPGVPRNKKKDQQGKPDDVGASSEGSEGGSGNTDRSNDGQSSNVRTVSFRSGGSATFAFNVDFFTLSDPDRTWLLGIVDKMRKYSEGQPALPSGESEDADDEIDFDEEVPSG